MRSYFLRKAAKQAPASSNWCTVSHLAALLLLRAPHFLWRGTFVFNTYNSCIPTASQLRITAEILWGSATFSSTTVKSFCRLESTASSRWRRSGVMVIWAFEKVETLAVMDVAQ